MTEQEFEEAVVLLQRRGGSARVETWPARAVFGASLEFMGYSLDNTPSDADLAAFLAGLDQGSRKQLKALADEKLALGL